MRRARLKKGVQLLIFLSILLLAFTELTWQQRANPAFSMKNMIGFKPSEPFDVVLFGASSVHCNYQPMLAWKEKGYTSYNYSASNNPADLIVEQVEAFRAKGTASFYLFDLRTLITASEKLVSAHFRHWSDTLPLFSPVRIKAIASYLSKKDLTGEDVLSYFLDIAKYHTNYDALLHPSTWPLFKRLTYRMLERGFNGEITTNCVPFQRPQSTSGRGELTDYQRRTLDELLDYCDREQLQALFVVAPYIITEEQWQIYNSCTEIIREHGYDFVNFNKYYDEIGLNFETDFADINHLNYLGSEKYTRYLSDFLCQRYDLPDHRRDQAYSNWAEDSIEYAEMQKQWRGDLLDTLEQYETAKEIGQRLSGIENFAAWFELVQNENFTVLLQGAPRRLLAADDPIAASLVQSMEVNWNLDLKEPFYAGIWNGKNGLMVAHDSDIHEGEIGVDGGRGTVACTIQAGENPKLTIGEIEYGNESDGIQAVVFDNNYQKVVDCVNIRILDGSVQLIR